VNRIEKKRSDIFEIKCNDTTTVAARIAMIRHKKLKKKYHRDCSQNNGDTHKIGILNFSAGTYHRG